MYRKNGLTEKSNVMSVNERFFENWNCEMAYVLGFFAADGCLTKNEKRQNYYIEFVSTDLEILKKIKIAMQAMQKITNKIPSKIHPPTKPGYRIQIGSKKMFNDLVNLGFTTNKSKTLEFPKISRQYICDFTRGLFDGDGYSNFCRYFSKDRDKYKKVLLAGFASGSESFLVNLKSALKKMANIEGGTLCPHSNNYALAYSVHDSRKLFNFMYNNLDNKIFLERKFLKFKSEIAKYGSVA